MIVKGLGLASSPLQRSKYTFNEIIQLTTQIRDDDTIEQDLKNEVLREQLLKQIGVVIDKQTASYLFNLAGSIQFQRQGQEIIEYLLKTRGLVEKKNRYSWYYYKNLIKWDGSPPSSEMAQPDNLIGFPDEFEKILRTAGKRGRSRGGDQGCKNRICRIPGRG